MILRVAGLVLLALSAGCNLARSCTLMGCLNGLIVEFGMTATVPYRVEVHTGMQTVNVYECPVVTQCHAVGAMFEDYFPDKVTIKVITATGTTSTQVTPTYAEYEPNGKGCGPTCRTARVTVPFPAG